MAHASKPPIVRPLLIGDAPQQHGIFLSYFCKEIRQHLFRISMFHNRTNDRIKLHDSLQCHDQMRNDLSHLHSPFDRGQRLALPALGRGRRGRSTRRRLRRRRLSGIVADTPASGVHIVGRCLGYAASAISTNSALFVSVVIKSQSGDLFDMRHFAHAVLRALISTLIQLPVMITPARS